MPTATLEALEQRLTAMERKIAALEQQAQDDNRQRTKSGWKSIVGTLTDSPEYDEATRLGSEWRESQRVEDEDANPQEMSQRERVMALRAKLKPISQEDADMMNSAIMEAREASIVHYPPA